MRAKWVYGIAAGLILASWLGNYLYYRTGQLPEAGFLRHYIEATDRGGTIDLYYIANKNDRRKLTQVTIEGLPEVRFQPPQVHVEGSQQTVYKTMGIVQPPDGEEPTPAAEPLVIREVYAYFSDGSMSRADIGEIRIYRDAFPPPEEGAPLNFTMTSGSSDGTGSSAFHAVRPGTLAEVRSAWLSRLGNSFEWKLTTIDRSAGQRGLSLPAELSTDQSVTLSYRYSISEGDPIGMDVYQMVLRLTYKEADGREWTGNVFTHYSPYPTNEELRAYVRAKKEEVT